MSNDHDPCLYCRIPATDVSGCGVKTKHCHRQEFIDQVCNMVSSAAWEPDLTSEGGCPGEIVDAAIVAAFKKPEPTGLIVDEAGPTEPEMFNTHKHKGLRTEGDEYVCNHCKKRWGFDDPDVPGCD